MPWGQAGYEDRPILYFPTQAALLAVTNLPADAKVVAVAEDTNNTYRWNGAGWTQLNIAPTTSGTVGSHAYDGAEHTGQLSLATKVSGHTEAAHDAIGVYADQPLWTEGIRGSVVALNPFSPPQYFPWKVKLLETYAKVQTAPTLPFTAKLRYTNDRTQIPTGTVQSTLTISTTTEVIQAENTDFLAGYWFWWDVAGGNGSTDLRVYARFKRIL